MRALHRRLIALGIGLGIAGCAGLQPRDELRAAYESRWAPRLVPMVMEVVRFPTYAGNTAAFVAQKAWLERTARELGFSYTDAGKVTEIELPATPGAPVLGLAVHGDVVPVDDHWSFPPFEPVVRNGMVLGRGVADDKGPLVQALLAMKVIAESGRARTHAIRLLVGSDEESSFTDFKEYLATHKAPDVTLVLDSSFPVVVGERASGTLYVETPLDPPASSPPRLVSLNAGIATNIVPDLASVELQGDDDAQLDTLERRVRSKPLPEGIRLEIERRQRTLVLRTKGKASHSGVNPTGGRNALVAMANLLPEDLPAGHARELMSFTALAGRDLRGTGLGIAQEDPMFGYPIVVPTIARTTPEGKLRVGVNIRSNPNASGAVLKEKLLSAVAAYNARSGGSLVASGTFTSMPLVHNPDAKIVKRLVASYRRATGRSDPPAISGGGTYAKVIPNSIVYGMWFPGKPYPGHDVDEQESIADLHEGARALLEAVADIVFREPLVAPLAP
jgi:predicted dipeptidase